VWRQGTSNAGTCRAGGRYPGRGCLPRRHNLGLRFGADADVRVLLQHANATAALNCGAMGAQGGLPKRELVDDLVTRAYGAQSK
jgi:hypothetical protein